MSTLVVGDVQGCFDSLMALTSAMSFDRERDELCFVGDVVNRGDKNLEVLRWIRGLGDRAHVVLGNHDLHALSRFAEVSPKKKLDTIDDVLDADDADELLTWLRHQPVALRRGRYLMVHAGVLPSWTDAVIDELARELEAALRSERFAEVLAALVAGRDIPFSGAMGDDRLAAVSAVFQRVRAIDESEHVLDFSGAPRQAPEGARPWFDVRHQRDENTCVLFGHWSALGLLVRDDVVCLDTGCVWGRELTGIDLESGVVTSVAASD